MTSNVKRKVKKFLVRHKLRWRQGKWGIGLYKGHPTSGFEPYDESINPVLDAGDVEDVRAEFVADPFWVYETDRFFMFFEVMNAVREKGEIGCATSKNGTEWTYRRIVLREPFHLSYPFVFNRDGHHYMIPEATSTESVRLYRATSFPDQWELEQVLLTGHPFSDATLLRHENKWWIFVGAAEEHEYDTLRLYFAEHLLGPWTEHPSSPIVESDAAAARPAGRLLKDEEGRIIRYAQDCTEAYGKRVHAFEVLTLTAEAYREQFAGVVLEPAERGWNGLAMHHIDARMGSSSWFAVVDGLSKAGWRWGIFDPRRALSDDPKTVETQ